MNRARVPMLDESAAVDAAVRAGVPEVLGRLNAFRALLSNEPLAKGLSDLLLALLAGRALDPRLRELAVMRIAWSTASAYEWTQHWPIAVGVGIPEADLLGVRQWRDHDGFGEVERAVLEATDEALAEHRVGEEVVASLAAHLTPAALVELVSAIGTWTMVSTLLRTLEIPLEEGVAPWPPDGLPP